MASENDVIPRKVVIPTGFETAQQEIEMRQRLADALMQQGMTTKDNMISPLQVLGQLAQAFVGSRMEGRALGEQGKLNKAIRDSYTSGAQGLFGDARSGMSDQAIVEKYATNPLLADLVKPYSEAYAHGRSEGETPVFHNGTIAPTSEFMHKPVFDLPSDVIPSFQNGNLHESVNWPVVAAKAAGSPMSTMPLPLAPGVNDQATIQGVGPMGQPPAGGGQPPSTPPAGSPSPAPVPPAAPNDVANAIRQRLFGAVGQVESGNRDYYPNGSPVVNHNSGAHFKMQVLPSTAHHPGFGVLPARADTPAEYDRVGEDYLTAMLGRYHNNLPQALGAYNAGPGTMDHAIAAGGPLPAQGYAHKVMGAMGGPKPPDGMTTDGKPYWIVNGQPFDNPQGE